MDVRRADAVAGDDLVQAPGIGRLRMPGERRPQRDHLPDFLREVLRELAGVEAAQAPADQADLALVGPAQRLQLLLAAREHAFARPQVGPDAPAHRQVALALEVATQRLGGSIGGHQAREEQDRMPIALRCLCQPRLREQRRAVLPGRPPLHREADEAGSPHQSELVPVLRVVHRCSVCSGRSAHVRRALRRVRDLSETGSASNVARSSSSKACCRPRARRRMSGIAERAAISPKSSEPA